MGKKGWSAFECAVFAEKSDNPDEQKRLFTYGYEQGRKFLEAVNNGKVEAKDISSTVPLGFTLLMQGPSTEFILGRIWEGAAQTASEEVYEGADHRTALWRTVALRLFQERNCVVVGR